MNYTSETLINAVQRVILNFENVHCNIKNVSIQEIADKANSSYTTIREIKKGILKNLSIKKALEISSRLNGPENLEALVSDSDMNTNKAKDFTKKYSHLFDYSLMPDNFDELITNKDFTKILWAAFSNNHISRKEVSLRWGKEGEDKLNFLLVKGIIIEESGIIKGVADKAGADIESGYKQLGIGHSLYNIAHADKEENWVSFQTNSVNMAFIKEFREELREVFKKFNEKSDTLKYNGNKQVFLGLIFDRYIEDLDSQKDMQ